tara:strand:- start:58 stop:423 length:366 start_codon:yes stop_codon:yes gene_type:complete
MTEEYGKCPFKKDMECWIYEEKLCNKVYREPYFGSIIHENCDKLNLELRLEKKNPPKGEPFKTIEDELSVYEFLSPLTREESEYISKIRLEELEKDYLEFGEVHTELIEKVIDEFRKNENN